MVYDNHITMTLLETCFYRISVFICLASACYMTYLQFLYFLDNEDVVSISYQKFNKEEKDEYPSFSICLVGYKGEIFKSSFYTFESTNVTLESYQSYLLGDLEDYLPQLSAIRFDDVALDIHESYLLRAREFSIQYVFGESLIYFWNSPLDMKPSSFRDVGQVCVTKNISYRKDTTQKFDYVALNSTMLYEIGLNVFILIHQKGRLMKSLGTQYTIYPDEKMKQEIFKIYDIGQVDLLRKRENSKMPCDKNMKDEDEYILKQIILNVGCIPTYWENFAHNVGLNQTTRVCTSRIDYNTSKHQYWNALRNLNSAYNIYKQPCTEMVTLVTARDETSNIKEYYLYGHDKNDNASGGVLHLQFNYQQNMYREIINSKAYTGESLLGQVGGFVGIHY